MVVRNIFENAGLQPLSVVLGDVELQDPPTSKQLEEINDALRSMDFEILNDEKKKIIEKIKNTIVAEIQNESPDSHRNFSEIISSALNKEYSYLSKLFSEAEGVTIEKYIIDQRIERVKELLAYGEMNLNEISYQLGYSSTAHLSSQFKKVTGFNPTEFRKQHHHQRRPIDEI